MEKTAYYVLAEIKLRKADDGKGWVVRSPYGSGWHSLLCRAIDHVKAHALLLTPIDTSFNIPGWDLM